MKTYHMAKAVTENGDVSALCYKHPRAINLRLTSWTIRPDAVTCPKCKKAMEYSPFKANG